MSNISQDWTSPDGVGNASQLRAHYEQAFSALAEVDALGHRVLKRASDSGTAGTLERMVGLSLLRRGITQFVGVRHSLEHSAVQPAYLIARSLYESFLSMRYLVHGGNKRPQMDTESRQRGREVRARYYFVASRRAGICKRLAMLAGADGAKRIRKKADRAAMEREIQQEITLLNKYFPSQQARFGPLPCLPAGKKRPKYYDSREWFSFGFASGKVNSVKALSKRLDPVDAYFVFYSPASALGHAQGTGHDGAIEGKHLEIYSPYIPDGFEYLVFWVVGWQQLLIAYFAKAYHPESWPDVQAVSARVNSAVHRLEAVIPAWMH